jgi:hypothetical protein
MQPRELRQKLNIFEDGVEDGRAEEPVSRLLPDRTPVIACSGRFVEDAMAGLPRTPAAGAMHRVACFGG